MIDTSAPGWDNHDAKIDARMVELGMAAETDTAPGAERYYGDVQPGERYEGNAAVDLGLMPDGSFRSPAVAQAALEVWHATTALDTAEEDRDAGRGSSEARQRAENALWRAEGALRRAERAEAGTPPRTAAMDAVEAERDTRWAAHDDAAADLERARQDQAAARETRDRAADPSLAQLDAVCWGNVEVHRAELAARAADDAFWEAEGALADMDWERQRFDRFGGKEAELDAALERLRAAVTEARSPAIAQADDGRALERHDEHHAEHDDAMEL